MKKTLSLRFHDRTEQCHRFGVNALASTAELLYSAGRDGSVRCWDLASGATEPPQLAVLEGHTDWVNDVCIAGDSAVVSCSSDQTVRVWGNASRGHTLITTLYGHDDYVKSLDFCTKSQLLVSCSLDQRILLWDLSQEACVRPLEMNGGTQESMYSVAIDESGSLVVSGSTQHTVRLWDVRARGHSADLQGHVGHVRRVIVDAGGTKLTQRTPARACSCSCVWPTTQAAHCI